ncbi:MAG: DNA-3-methyladenine glycosylase family protein, partial [Tuberibacillus sp.]
HHKIRTEFLNYIPQGSDRLKCADEVWECFDLGRNLDGFYRMAVKDKVLKPLVHRYRGFRIVGITDLFEAMTWAVIGQQINLPFAYTLKRRMVEAYGQHITYNDENYWLYPTPERMAEATVQELTALQFTGRKAEYIIDIAKMITKGELLKDHLNHEDAETTLKRLISIRGIGQWTAQYVMLRCLKIPTAIPMTDVGLQNDIKAQLKMKRKPTIDEIERLADGWDGWQAYATFYLWRSLLG